MSETVQRGPADADVDTAVFATIEEAVADIRAGKMVLVVDDADRENEGDFIMAAESVTPEDINFMVTHGRGIVCLPVAAWRLDELGIQQMVSEVNSDETAFTVSIDARVGTTTGTSHPSVPCFTVPRRAALFPVGRISPRGSPAF